MKSLQTDTLNLSLPNLLYALSICMAARTGRTTLAILSHCLLSSPIAGSEILEPTIQATDLDLWVTVPLTGTGGSLSSPLTMPLRQLHELSHQLDKGLETTLQAREEGKPGAVLTQIDGDDDPAFRATLLGLPSMEFPERPEVTPLVTLTFTGASLVGALQVVAPAISSDETRPILTGTLLRISHDTHTVRFVATDTHRLFLSQVVVLEELRVKDELTNVEAHAIEEIVLKKSLVEFIRRFVRDTDVVVMEIGHGDIRVRITQEKTMEGQRTIEVVGQLIQGKYPSYERVIPVGEMSHMVVPRKSLIAALRRLAILARDNAQRVVFDVTGAGTLYLNAECQALGSADVRVKGVTSNMEMKWALNVRYILSVLQTIPDNEVTIYGHESLRPFLVHGGQPRSTDNRLSGAAYVCMPMQVL